MTATDMKAREAAAFCRQWLPKWTGGQAEELVAFYAEDAFYRDPAKPQGLHGRAEIEPYFKKLLALNPEWVWEAVEIFPTEKGFTLKWKARIPTARGVLTEFGLDIVEIAEGKITRNEVYFDRVSWMSSMIPATGAAP